MHRRYYSLLILALGGVLLLPMLGSYGLWDPLETQHADLAQEVAKTGSFGDVTVGGKFSPRPVLYVWLVATGLKLFGVNETAGRLPLALCGIVALLLAYRAGRRLISERAGLVSALVLATTPAFLFQARQLISDMPYYTSLLASVGGLAAYLWPVDGRRSVWDLVIGGLGLVAGFLSAGLLLGVAFPVLGLALAIALSLGARHVSDPEGSSVVVAGSQLSEGMTLATALRSSLLPLLGTVAAAGVVIGLLLLKLKVTPYLLLGGEFRKLEIPPTFETLFKSIGFGFFPWFGMLPYALARLLAGQRSKDEPRPHAAFPWMLVLVLAAGGYVTGSIWLGYLGTIRYPALPWLAVAVGVALAEVLSGKIEVHRAWGIVAAGLLATLSLDFFMEPSGLAFSHLTSTAKYPIELVIKGPVRWFGVGFVLLFFLALGGVPGSIQAGTPRKGLRGLFAAAASGLDSLGSLVRRLGGQGGRWYACAVTVLALGFAGWSGFCLTPNLSLHLSNKGLFETFHHCRTGGEQLAQYQVAGRGAAYYNNGQVGEVRDQSQLFSMLRDSRRAFVLIPSSYLASIDQAARQAGVIYYVLDDRNSQYLIISNRLEGTCNKDLNPLRRYVLSKPPKPGKVITANFENKVKLLGYDVPDVVRRGGKFTITLYFQVLSRMPDGYKLFIHFDQPANRFHGDHEPLDGKFATQYWSPGDYIIDPHEVEIPIITTPSGEYTMYMGFWLGEGRLKVTEGPNDGSNRVELGKLRVR